MSDYAGFSTGFGGQPFNPSFNPFAPESMQGMVFTATPEQHLTVTSYAPQARSFAMNHQWSFSYGQAPSFSFPFAPQKEDTPFSLVRARSPRADVDDGRPTKRRNQQDDSWLASQLPQSTDPIREEMQELEMEDPVETPKDSPVDHSETMANVARAGRAAIFNHSGISEEGLLYPERRHHPIFLQPSSLVLSRCLGREKP